MLPSFYHNFNTTPNSDEEDHGSWIECLCCYKSFAPHPTIYKDNKIIVEILSDLFSTFSKYMKWDSPPQEYQFDFMEDKFPFCRCCRFNLVRIFKLDERLQQIISNVISTIVSCEKEASKKNRDEASEKMEFYRRQTILQHQPEPYSVPLKPAMVENFKRVASEKEHSPYFRGQCSNAREKDKVLAPTSPSKSSSSVKPSTAAPQAKLSRRSKDVWQCLACDESCATKSDLLLHWETRPCFRSEQSIEIVETFQSHDDDDPPHSSTRQKRYILKKREELSNPSQKQSSRCIICRLCDASFKSKQSLQRHTLTLHVDESRKKFACKICSRKFVSRSLLNHHLSGHKKKPCPDCGKIYPAREMSKHKKKQHKLSPKVYKCKFCHQSFPLIHGLTVHLKSCEKNASAGSSKNNPAMDPNKGPAANQKITCQFCRKTFSHKNNLYVHIRKFHTTPEQDKTFQCRVCKKKFASKSILKVHFNHVHEKVECDICSEIFYSANSIFAHKYFLHKSVDCTVCDKRFKLNAFQEHVNWHKEQDSDGRISASYQPRRSTKVARPPRRQHLTKSATS